MARDDEEQFSRKRDKAPSPVLRYVAMPLLDLVTVFERALREGKIEEALEVLRRSPGSRSSLLVPSSLIDEFVPKFQVLAVCAGTTGTWGPPTVTLTLVRDSTAGAPPGTVPAGQSRITVAFTYTTGATGACIVTITDVQVALRGGTFRTVTPAADNGSSYTGTARAPAPPAATSFGLGMPVQVDVYFSGSAPGWCDTCTATGPTSVTVFGTVT